MKVILVGAAGRMGLQMTKTLEENGETLAAAVDTLGPKEGRPCHRDIFEVDEDADAILDFSSARGTQKLVEFALRRDLPLVIATTGQNEHEKDIIAEASKRIPIFFCANMSFGVSLFSSLVERVAKAFPYADVEIVETHHASKADAPSGTALMLANAVIAARGFGRITGGASRVCRQVGDVGISSLRLGERAGTHEVIFDTGFQLISLRHEAFGRELFARGALNALRFIVDKPAGLYGMNDIRSLRGE